MSVGRARVARSRGIRRCVEKLGDGLQIHDCVARPRVWSYDLDAVGALRP
jgi:hypothetical protein